MLFDRSGNLFVQAVATSALPQIIGQLQNRVVPLGEATSFSVVVFDTRALAYQWQFNGGNIPGATNDAVLVRNAGTSDEGEYRVVLTHPSGSVTSAPAMLWIDSDADGLPDAWEKLHFSNLNQNATSDFDGDGVSNVAEFLGNTNPTNRLSARFALTVLAEGNGLVETNPKGASFTNGQSVTLTATPSGTNLFYGWNGSYSSTNNPLVITIASNTIVRAHFQFLPLDIVWTNIGGGDWHSATNWSPQQVPGAVDNAIIPITATVTVNSPAECLGLTLGSVSGNPTLTGSGTLLIHDNLLWTLGTMSGSGRTILNTNVTANIPANVLLSARTLENRGAMFVYNTGGFNVMSGGVFTNCAGASVHVVNETPSLGGGLANGRFDNAGSFEKSSGLGTLIVNPGLGFNNFGTVDIQSGLLLCEGGFTNSGGVNVSAAAAIRLAGGGSATGSFEATGGALIDWTGGTFALNPGAHFEGDGLYRINGGTWLANADIAMKKLELRTGTLGGTGTLTITNAINWTGGGMSGGGRTLISTGATLIAALPSGAGLNARTLENAGTILWTGAGNLGFVSAVITNRPGAIFEAMGAGGMTFVSGLNRFDNAGTFRKSVNSGTLEIFEFSGSSRFNNFGRVEIQAGTFHCNAGFTNFGVVQLSSATTNRLAGGGSATGTFETPSTALMEWTGRSFALNPGAQLNGPGLHRINGTSANVAVNGDVSVQNFDLVTGDSALTALSGTGRLTILNAMNWNGGAMSGAGRTIISPAATLSLANANSIGLQRILENAGTTVWTGSGTIGLLNGVITNRAGALFEAQNSARFFFAGGSCRFDNVGTFRKLGTAGTTTIDAGLPFNNAGTVEIRDGILAANGGFISTSNALLSFGLGGTQAGTNHGQLRTSGTIALNGGLSVDLLSGYTPALNDSFTVLTAGTRTGVFNQFSYPSNVVSMQLSNSPTSVVLGVTNVNPPPEVTPTLSVEIQGGGLQICWPTSSNVTYRVEFSSDLASTNWTTLSGSITATNNTTCFTDSPGASNRFYRVRLSP